MNKKPFSAKTKKNTVNIAILCGGPSLERGISLNSARSVMDHLGSLGVEIVSIYFNEQKKPFRISTGALYSNTPSDFDFKLKNGNGAQTAEVLAKPVPVSVLTQQVLPVPRADYDLCPSCGEAALVHEEGCKKCYGCGYSEC